ncbi:hypothetical protein PR202_gb03013 [Eleusine coracana subsp. coracana]|uniref:Uncharacterized protein n=1 Tax=Eleusine coracana subsp. coracana TaxID=191504 RepID=A0AAV5DYJ1_ELECO|nr:hypothetical protein PR202_gb03013 [Eleusine coracana subsp. coracana]
MGRVPSCAASAPRIGRAHKRGSKLPHPRDIFYAGRDGACVGQHSSIGNGKRVVLRIQAQRKRGSARPGSLAVR